MPGVVKTVESFDSLGAINTPDVVGAPLVRV
jgi:hypothetical protein